MGKCCGSFKKNVKHRNLGNSRKKNLLQLNSYNLQFGEVPQIVGYVYNGVFVVYHLVNMCMKEKMGDVYKIFGKI